MQSGFGSMLFPALEVDRNARVPYYRQLYNGIRNGILKGQLRPGTRLPSTRALASELQVARNTAMNAFEQLLAEGYLEGKVGSGTYVSRSLPEDMLCPSAAGGTLKPVQPRLPRLSAAGKRAASVSFMFMQHRHGAGAFRTGVPALKEFPWPIWSRIMSRISRTMPKRLLTYTEPAGYKPLRDIVAEYVRTARAVRCETDQVFIVSGAQHALFLCSQLLLNAGDRVWIEDPQYLGARGAFTAAGAELIPMPVDNEGMNFEAAAKGPIPQLAYVTPSHQFPLGPTMSLRRRLQLIDFAKKRRTWIIEDDYDSEFRYASRPLSSLQGLDTAGRVIYVGTFSKMLFPALRLGYVVLPPELVRTFENIRAFNDLFSPIVEQAVMAEFISDGHFARHLRRMRLLYGELRNTLLREVTRELGDFLQVHHADAGMHVVGLLPPAVDDKMISQHAQRGGVIARALSSCYLRKPERGGLILGYGGLSQKEIREGVQRLANAIVSPRAARIAEAAAS